jgi:hypothetical protein
MNKYFEETIIRKALDVKHAFLDEQIQTQLEAAPKPFYKNVCTPIPLHMNEELERVIQLLDISKGRFLYMAIESALDEARDILRRIDVNEYVRDQNEAVIRGEFTEEPTQAA